MGPAVGSFGLSVGTTVGVSVLGPWVELDVVFDVVGASDGEAEGGSVLERRQGAKGVQVHRGGVLLPPSNGVIVFVAVAIGGDAGAAQWERTFRRSRRCCPWRRRSIAGGCHGAVAIPSAGWRTRG